MERVRCEYAFVLSKLRGQTCSMPKGHVSNHRTEASVAYNATRHLSADAVAKRHKRQASDEYRASRRTPEYRARVAAYLRRTNSPERRARSVDRSSAYTRRQQVAQAMFALSVTGFFAQEVQHG